MKITKEDIQKYATKEELIILEKYKKPDGYVDAIGRKRKKNPKSVGDKSKYASEWERGKQELQQRKIDKQVKKDEIEKKEKEIKDIKKGKTKVVKEDTTNDQETAKWYIDKYFQKMSGSNSEETKDWVNGTNQPYNIQELIFDGIKKGIREDIENYATEDEKKILEYKTSTTEHPEHECQVCGKSISAEQAEEMSDTCSEYCLWIFAKVHPKDWNEMLQNRP